MQPSARVPLLLLGLLVLLHLALAHRFNQQRGYYPTELDNYNYVMILDFLRVVDGYAPSERIAQHPKNRIYIGRRDERQAIKLATLWYELTQGRLQGLWRNRDPAHYNNELPHPWVLPAVLHLISGGSIAAVALAPQVYLTILLLSVYGLARRLADPWVGLAAAAIVSGYVGIFGMARTHHDANAAAALSVALVYLLWRSSGFRNLGSVLAAGVTAMFAMRSGENVARTALVALVVAMPFLFAIKRLVAIGRRDRAAAIHGAAGLALLLTMIGIAFDWSQVESFFISLSESKMDNAAYPQIARDLSPSLYSLFWYLAYPIEISIRLVRPIMTLWFLAGVLFFLRRPMGARRIALGMMFLVPLAILTLVDRKGSWYLVPLLPPMALLTALGLARIRLLRRRRIALGLASFCAIFILCFRSVVPVKWQQEMDIEFIAPGISDTIHINSVRLMDSNHMLVGWKLEASIAEAADVFVKHLRLNPPPAGEIKRVAWLAKSDGPEHAFRYMLELREPKVFLISLLSTHLAKEDLVALANVDFDYLIFSDDTGLIPWVDDPSSFFGTTIEHHEVLQLKDRPWPQAEIIEKLMNQQWEQLKTPGVPIYRRIGTKTHADLRSRVDPSLTVRRAHTEDY